MSSNFRLDLYERKERLGSGAFGTVFRYGQQPTIPLVIVKVLPFTCGEADRS